MERTNEMWLEHLRDHSPHRTEALEDLRRQLKRHAFVYLYGRSDLNYLDRVELEQMSEDFVQEALLKIKANLDTFRGNSKFTTWATKITSNHIISELRRAKWRDLSLDALTEAGASLQEILANDSHRISHPDIETEQRQIWQTVIRVIDNDLTERQRCVMAAVHFEDIPMAEVAWLLDTNVNNIYKLMHDARRKLKRRLLALGLETGYILSLFSQASATNSRLLPSVIPVKE